MILAARQSMWNDSLLIKSLPDWDYPIEYLQSNGTQHIDLGIIPKDYDTFDLEWQPLDTLSLDRHYHGKSYCCGLGIYRSCYRPTGYAEKAFQCWEGTQGPGLVWPPAVLINNITHTIFRQDPVHTTIYDVVNKQFIADFPIVVNGNDTGDANTIWLFWMHNNPINKGSCKVWNFFYKQQDLSSIMYLQPCVKNGQPCLVDVFSNNYYYDPSNKTFIAGPQISLSLAELNDKVIQKM